MANAEGKDGLNPGSREQRQKVDKCQLRVTPGQKSF